MNTKLQVSKSFCPATTIRINFGRQIFSNNKSLKRSCPAHTRPNCRTHSDRNRNRYHTLHDRSHRNLCP